MSGGRKVHLPSVPEVVMRLDVVVAIAAAAAVSSEISGTTANEFVNLFVATCIYARIMKMN